MKLKKRYLFLVGVGILTFINVFHFGDYCYGILNTFLFIVFSILFGIFFLSITFYNLYKISLKKERFDFIPGILLLFFSILIIYTVKYPDFYIHKTRIKTFKSIRKIDSTTTKLILFSNYTFEAKTILEKSECTKKGKYSIKNDSLYLKNNNAVKQKYFDNVYFYNQKDGFLVPKNNYLPALKIAKKVSK